MRQRRSGRQAQRDKNFIALTEKVFGVLEAIGARPEATVSLEDVTRAVGLAKTSVHRLLYSLRKIGYIDQNADTSRYMLSEKFFELVRNAFPYQRLPALARPLLNALVRRFGESSHMAILEDGLVTYIAIAESQNPYRCAAALGETGYAHSTALGKCLLAYLPEGEVDEVLRQHGLPKLTASTITDRVRLSEELEKVRQQGFAINRNENLEGVICVAAPVFRQPDRPIAALSISGPSIRMEHRLATLEAEVQRVATRLSRMLGGSRP